MKYKAICKNYYTFILCVITIVAFINCSKVEQLSTGCEILSSHDHSFSLNSEFIESQWVPSTKDVLISLCPDIVDTTFFDSEGNSINASLLIDKDETIGIIEWDSSVDVKARLIIIKSTKYISPDSIRVGDTLADLTKRIEAFEYGYDSMGVYVWNSTRNGFSYLLEPFERSANQVDLSVGPKKMSIIPPDTRVRQIIVVLDK